MQRDTRWLKLNLFAIAAAFVGGLLTLRDPRARAGFEHPSLTFPFVIAGLCAFGVLFCVGLQIINPNALEVWRRPSLYDSPFGFSQPLQNFYAGSFVMLAYGVGYLVYGVFDPAVRWAWELPIPAALGLWLGVRLCMWGMPDRFEPTREHRETQ
jgi:hypothetical protein